MPSVAAKPTRLAYPLKEAAELIGVSRTTLYKFRKLGLLPVCEVAGYTGILHSDLLAFLQQHRKLEGVDAR